MITKEQAMELYGEVPCVFSSYYKYSFTFKGTASDGAEVYLSIGGMSDDVYRLDVDRDKVFKPLDGYTSLTVRKDGEDIYDEFDSGW